MTAFVLPLQLHGHKDGDNADGEEDGVDNLAGAVAERRPRHLPAADRGVQPARRLAPAAHRAVVLSAKTHAVKTAAVAVVVTGLQYWSRPALQNFPPTRPATRHHAVQCGAGVQNYTDWTGLQTYESNAPGLEMFHVRSVLDNMHMLSRSSLLSP